MGRVKKGSALLNVLMIAMILTMTAGVITTAVVQTTKGNVYKKETDDLTYAAESGIQQAISNVDNLLYNDTTLALGATTTFNIDDQFVDQEIKVNVEVTRNNDNATYNAKSTSTKTVDGVTRSRTVKAVLRKTFNGTFGADNLLKYTLCGNNTFLYGIGTGAAASALVNGSESIYAVDSGGTAPVEVPVEKKKYLTPEFDKIPYAGDEVVITTTADLDTLIGLGMAKKEQYTPPAGHTMNIYMINAKNVVWKYTSGFSVVNTIIVCSGNFTVIHNDDYDNSGMKSGVSNTIGVGKDGLPLKDATGKYIKPTPQKANGVMHVSGSSIIAQNVSLYVSNFTTDYPTYGSSHSNIKTPQQLEEINKLIRLHSSTWASNNVVDGEQSWSDTEVTYE